MIILGLTGSIAMGKSTAAIILESMGCAIHDSDEAVRKIYKDDKEFKKQIAEYFPEAYTKKSINKQILSKLVFSDPEKKHLLENLLHPKVWESQHKFLKKCRRLKQKIAVLDIPLLFETGAEVRCDYVIVVTAPEHIQRARVLARPNMTEEKFANILNSQMSDIEKRARADFIVNAGLGRKRMRQDLQTVLANIS